MKLSITAAALLCSTLGTPVSAGPFGIDVLGFDLDTYSCTPRDGQFYSCTAIPKPHDEFESYNLRFHKDAGLCSIQAIGKDINDSGFGSTTKSRVDALHQQISQKYGEIKKSDLLLPSSIWNEPDEWLMGLAQSERIYAYIGDVEPPVEEIKTYGVMASATSRDVGFVIVEFLTINYDKCEEALNKDGASSF